MSRVLCRRFSILRDILSSSSYSVQNVQKITPALSAGLVSPSTCTPSRKFARGSKFSGQSPPNEANDETKLGRKEVDSLLKHSTIGYPQDFKTPEHLWETNPYQQDPTLKRRAEERNQAAKSVRSVMSATKVKQFNLQHYNFFHRPTVDPKETSIIIFPGQGVQYVGMCKELLKFPLVKDLFDVASSILGYDLLKICLEGPQEKLNQTKYCQPAVLVSSLAAVEWLKEERPSAIEGCVATAGFSVGEITALVFAGALTYESGK